jgi:hypothetical protein
MRLTRARVSQLPDLTLLAPDVQEQVLLAEGAAGVEGGRSLRRVSALRSCAKQRAALIEGEAPRS